MLTRLKEWFFTSSDDSNKADDDEGEEASAAADDSADASGSDEEKPITVALEDFAAVKRALDDAVVETVLDRGYAEDGRLFGAKLGLGLAACAVALVAQFYPGKPPATAPVLAACIVAYIVLTAAAAAFSMVAEGDAFLVTRQPDPKSGRKSDREPGEEGEEGEKKRSEKTALLPQDCPHLPPIRVSSNMARFDPDYELVVKTSSNDSNGGKRSDDAVEARAQLKATSFFRSDGTLEVSLLRAEVGKLLDEVEEKTGAAKAGGGERKSRRQSPRTKKN